MRARTALLPMPHRTDFNLLLLNHSHWYLSQPRNKLMDKKDQHFFGMTFFLNHHVLIAIS